MRWLFLFALKIYTLPSLDLCLGRLTFTDGTVQAPFPSVFQLYLVTGRHKQEMGEHEKDEHRLFISPMPSLLGYIAGSGHISL